MYQQTCIFHLILRGIPYSLVWSVKNRMGGLLNGKNPLNMTKVIWFADNPLKTTKS